MPANKLTKPWSISTTVRNPERLRGFLSALEEIEGEVWNNANQVRFQTILIQKRIYGAHNTQFLSGLDPDDVELLNGEDNIPLCRRPADIRLQRICGSCDERAVHPSSLWEKFGFASLNSTQSSVQMTFDG